MYDINSEVTITNSLKLLRDGLKKEFATFVLDDIRMSELLMELAIEFVDANVPITKEDYDVELSMMLIETIDIVAR